MQVSEVCQGMSRFERSLLAKKKYTSFYLTQTLPRTYTSIVSSKEQLSIIYN